MTVLCAATVTRNGETFTCDLDAHEGEHECVLHDADPVARLVWEDE